MSRIKLPKARKRGDAYSISIAYEKKRYYCTRDTAKECEQWAAIRLLEMKAKYNPKKAKEEKPYFSFMHFATNTTMRKVVEKEENLSSSNK